MHQHRWIERSVIAEGRVAQEVLQVGVLPDLLDRLFIAQLQFLLDDQAADRDARDQRRRTETLRRTGFRCDPRESALPSVPSGCCC